MPRFAAAFFVFRHAKALRIELTALLVQTKLFPKPEDLPVESMFVKWL